MLIGAWPVLLWPVLAGLLVNRSLLMQRFSLLHVPVACYVARGLVFDLWGWPGDWDHMTLSSTVGLGVTGSIVLLTVCGWLIWIAGLFFLFVGDRMLGAPRQFWLLLALIGMWLTLGGVGGAYQQLFTIWGWILKRSSEDEDHPLPLPPVNGWFWGLPNFGSAALQAARALGGGTTTASTAPASNATECSHLHPAHGVLAGAYPLPLTETRQAQAPAAVTTADSDHPVDDGSARAAGARERAALSRAAWFDQFVRGKPNRKLLWSLQDQARTAHDDATRWQVAGLARLRREVKMAQRATATEPVRPLTKNCLPALLPMTHPADLRTLERWAVRVGAAVRLGDGRTLNALGERWPMQRIDAELPALPLPQLIDVWLRTRALLAPDRLPGDDDWNWLNAAPGEATAHPTAEFTIAMDGEVAIPARLVDVSDLRWLEELYAVEGSWTARQEAGDDAAATGSDRWQAVQVAPADRRLLERHAFAIGASIGFEDGREVNAHGERWSRQRIDAELPRLPDGGPV